MKRFCATLVIVGVGFLVMLSQVVANDDPKPPKAVTVVVVTEIGKAQVCIRGGAGIPVSCSEPSYHGPKQAPACPTSPDPVACQAAINRGEIINKSDDQKARNWVAYCHTTLDVPVCLAEGGITNG